jgi:hypothetical protein
MRTVLAMNSEHNILGIDIGRVIIGAADDDGHADTSFLSGTPERAMQTPPAPGAFAAIARLAAAFGGAVWLISKCGPRVQAKTRRWLDHWGFWTATGVAPDHLRFCLERRDKALHCHELGVSHFIDDRLDVLVHLRGFVPGLYLFGYQKARAPDWVTPVITWPVALASVLSDLGCSAAARSP